MKKSEKYKNPSPALPDMDYFLVYPSPMFEAMFDQHVSQVNTTTTYHGPLLYWLCRDVNAINVLEIGMAQGWTSFFMAAAIKEECTRQGANGMYYGVDIDDKSELVERMKERGAPVTFIHKDSLDLKPEDWDEKQFELIFQDGWHSTEYIVDEFNLLRPYLKDNGFGYWVMHDCYSWGEEGFLAIKKLVPDWECVRFLANYGLAIFRNMDNYDHGKKFWNGPQKPAYPNKEQHVS